MHGVTLLTHPGVPCGGGFIAIDVAIPLDVIILLRPGDDAAPNESLYPAGMGVIGGTHVGERMLVFILLFINLLPVPLRVDLEGIPYLHRNF
jgi:hypothetical protein